MELSDLLPKNNTVKIVVYVAGGVMLFLVARKYLKKWGLIEDKDKQRQEKEREQSELYNLLAADESAQVQGQATITKTEARKYANQIKAAWGVLNDDEEAIYNVFNRVRNLADILYIIDEYGIYKPNALVTGRDLVSDLRARLSAAEIKKINEIITSKGINYTI